MGATLLGRLWPRNDEDRNKAVEKGYDLNKELTIHVSGFHSAVNCGLYWTGGTLKHLFEPSTPTHFLGTQSCPGVIISVKCGQLFFAIHQGAYDQCELGL